MTKTTEYTLVIDTDACSDVTSDKVTVFVVEPGMRFQLTASPVGPKWIADILPESFDPSVMCTSYQLVDCLVQRSTRSRCRCLLYKDRYQRNGSQSEAWTGSIEPRGQVSNRGALGVLHPWNGTRQPSPLRESDHGLLIAESDPPTFCVVPRPPGGHPTSDFWPSLILRRTSWRCRKRSSLTTMTLV